MALTNKIRELRFKHEEMTQKALAGRVGVSRQTMNAIENGRHAPTIDVAIRIADVFRTTVDRLFDLDYEGKPARHEKAATMATHRTPAAVRKPVDTEREVEPVKKKETPEVTLASLRAVIGD